MNFYGKATFRRWSIGVDSCSRPNRSHRDRGVNKKGDRDANGTGITRRKGNAIIEFTLVFLLLLLLFVGAFEFTWVLFRRATFHHAVREGVRHALTGNALPGFQGQFDDSVKEVIRQQSFGFLEEPLLSEHVEIQYFDPSCAGQSCPVDEAAAGNIVQVSVLCYQVFALTTLIRRYDPITGGPEPFTFSVTSSGMLEPFPGAPPNRGTFAQATACP